MPDLTFETLLSRQLREYAEAGVRPVDRFAIAEATIASGQTMPRWRRGWGLAPMRGNRVLVLLLLGLLLAALGGGALLVGGRLLAPPPPLPTTPDAWSRVLIESAPDGGQLITLAASPRGLLAIVGYDQAARLVTSADGRNWTLVPTEQHPPLHGLSGGSVGMAVVGTDRGFLMVGEEGAWTSEDGYTWQRLASAAEVPDLAQGTVLAAAVGGPGFVAVGLDGKAWYSTDGSDWTLAEVPPTPIDYLGSLAVVGDQMVAVGGASLWASGNGRSWTDVTGPKSGWGAVAGGPGGFVAVNTLSVGTNLSVRVRTNLSVRTSADGRDWEEVAVFDSRWPKGLNDEGTPVQLGVESVAATTAGYVAVGNDGDCVFPSYPCRSLEAVIWTSPDGRSWSRLPSAARFAGAWARMAVAWESRFVVGGTYDDRPAVWISGLDQPGIDTGADSMPTEAPTTTVAADVELAGTWRPTNLPPDRTMEITALTDKTVEVTIRDDYASECDGATSTMTGVGGALGASAIVIPHPDYVCDDGTEAEALSGPPLEEQLRYFSFRYDPLLDALYDPTGLEWTRVAVAQ